MKNEKIQSVAEKFKELFGSSPLLVRSPGRINLIGEHTDYNEGFVFPAAIDKEIYFAFAPNKENFCRVFAYDYEEMNAFQLQDFAPVPQGWINYIMGVVAQLQNDGHPIAGFDCVFGGNIPIGAGLSSSAALENGVCVGLSSIFDLGLDKLSMVRYSQKAEHEFAGVACGIMDQFASMMGKAGHAIRLDCRTLEYSYFSLHLGEYQIVLCDTHVEHALADSEYNQRREECELGLAAVQNFYSGIKSLRDVTFEMLDTIRVEVPPTVYERCCYVLEENERLVSGAERLRQGDLRGFGKLMYGSHDGLSKKYEVSCSELDFLVDFTRDREEVLGARMMGGGFGGCTINLVKKDRKAAFETEIIDAYQEQFMRTPTIYEVNIVDGTSGYPG